MLGEQLSLTPVTGHSVSSSSSSSASCLSLGAIPFVVGWWDGGSAGVCVVVAGRSRSLAALAWRNPPGIHISVAEAKLEATADSNRGVQQ